MKILVTYPLSPRLVQPGLGDLVIYRPELDAQPENALLEVLAQHRPDAALVDGSCPSARILAAWRDTTRADVQLIRCHSQDGSPPVDVSGVEFHQVPGTPSHLPDDLRALGLAERRVMQHRAEQRLASCGVSPGGSGALAGSRVTLVGAGIVSLMIALELADRGARVEILEASPDPRRRPPWQRLGTTHGGDNARMFCFTEANNYPDSGRPGDAQVHPVFRHTVTEGGWLALEPEELDRRERAWIERFNAVPHWRSEVFTEDIHGFSVASHPLWKRLRRTRPELFEGVGFVPGVLRLYAEDDKADAAEALHARIGSLIRSLDAEELCRRHPACRPAVEDGQIARGLEVRGFTLQIHDFVAQLLAHLERRGVLLRWNTRVFAVEHDGEGHPSGLVTADGTVRSEHYVLSPGVYGDPLLEGTRTAGKIQGILGLWMSLPHLEPRLRHSIKLHREGHVGEDSNVTLTTDEDGRPTLISSSGYGFLGSHPLDMGSPQVARLFEALEETARRYFPRAWEQAVRDGTILQGRKACVRPFTCTGLGILDVAGTVDGGRRVIAAGHNTGGFAQSPAVAQAVAATLDGAAHPMQALYDPERGIRRRQAR